jgi:methyl-accepting chemotaxis protein
MADDTEQEIKKLTESLNKYVAMMQRTGAGSKEQKAAAAAIALLTAQLKEQRKAVINNAAEFNKLSGIIADAEKVVEEHNKTAERSKKLEEKRNKLVQDSIESMVKLGDATTQGYEKVSYFTSSFKNIPVLGPAFNSLSGSLDFNIDQFRNLSSFGADFGKSLVGMRLAASAAQLPLKDFADLVAQNRESLAGLYGTTSRGATSLGRLSESVRKRLEPELAGLGLTTEDINQFLGTYLITQQKLGLQEYKNDQLATQAVTNYAMELDKLRRLTGEQAQELDKEVNKRKNDAVFQARLGTLSEERATAERLAVAALDKTSPAMGEFVKNVLATGNPLTDLDRTLAATTPGLLETVRNFRENGGDVGELLKRISNSSSEFMKKYPAATIAFADGLSEAGKANQMLVNRFGDLEQAMNEQRAAADPATKELNEFRAATKRLKSAFESIQTSFLETLGPTLGNVFGYTNRQLTDIANNIVKFTRENPGATAAAFAAVMAAKYTTDFFREVAIVSTGVRIANGGLGGALAALGGDMKFVAGGLFKIVGPLYGLYEMFDKSVNIWKKLTGQSDDKTSIMRDITGIAGGIAAVAGLNMATGGAGIGGSLAAYGLGSAASTAGYDVITGMFDGKRASGGPTYSGSSYLVGERGPEIFRPGTSGIVSPLINKTAALSLPTTADTGTGQVTQINSLVNTLNNTMGNINETLRSSEKHLNTLIQIGMMQVDKATELKKTVAQLDYAIVK